MREVSFIGKFTNIGKCAGIIVPKRIRRVIQKTEFLVIINQDAPVDGGTDKTAQTAPSTQTAQTQKEEPIPTGTGEETKQSEA